jgi:hypothetical protein
VGGDVPVPSLVDSGCSITVSFLFSHYALNGSQAMVLGPINVIDTLDGRAPVEFVLFTSLSSI